MESIFGTWLDPGLILFSPTHILTSSFSERLLSSTDKNICIFQPTYVLHGHRPHSPSFDHAKWLHTCASIKRNSTYSATVQEVTSIHPLNMTPTALKVSVLSTLCCLRITCRPDEFTILPASFRDSPLIIALQLHGFCSTVSLHVFTVLSKYTSRSQWPRGLRPLAWWDWWFESHRRHGCVSVVSVVCCQVEVSATGWSFVQRSPTDCGASLCVI